VKSVIYGCFAAWTVNVWGSDEVAHMDLRNCPRFVLGLFAVVASKLVAARTPPAVPTR
jgi:hypothetical protein